MAGEAPVASGIRAFAGDVAAAFASHLAAAPRAWTAAALAAVGAAGWLDPSSLPVVALVAGSILATALPRRVPAAAAVLAVLPLLLTIASDTIETRFREPLETWAPALACGVAAAWGAGAPVRGNRLFRVGAIAASLGTAAAGALLLDRTDPEGWGAVLSVNGVVAVLLAGSPGAWIASLLLAVSLCLREVIGLDPVGMAEHLFHPVGTAFAVTTTAAAATRAVCGRRVDGEEFSARCALAIRRHALLATTVGVTLLWMADPVRWFLQRLWSGAARAFAISGGEAAAVPAYLLPGTATVIFVATHVAALDGLGKAIARASVAGAALGGVSILFAGWARLNAPAGTAPGSIADDVLSVAAAGAFVVVAALYARIAARRIPAMRAGLGDLVTAAVPVAFIAAGLVWESDQSFVIGLAARLVAELFLAATVHRLAVAYVPARTLLAGIAVATVAFVGAASLRSSDIAWLVSVATIMAGSLGRIVVYVVILRRIRSLTPVPEDHPILADFGTDLRLRAPAVPA